MNIMDQPLVVKRDITELNFGVIVQGVNCSGAYGAGLSGAFKKRWPEVYRAFIDTPEHKRHLGNVNFVNVAPNCWVLNCFTQDRYGRDGKRYASVDAIEECLWYAYKLAEEQHDLPLSMPKIGCGLGGLDWDSEVLPIVVNLMKEFPNVHTIVYEL